jgi:hypothetical protein
MKQAILEINAETFIERIQEQGLVKGIYETLFGFNSGYSIFIRMDESGKIYTLVESQNTWFRPDGDWDGSLIKVACGWSLQDELCNDEDYWVNEETGEWGVEGYEDPFDYWYEWAGDEYLILDDLEQRFKQTAIEEIQGQI